MATDSLDTNIILSYILGQPIAQVKKIEKMLDDGATHRIPDLAITEAVYVLEDHYEQGRADIAAMFMAFLAEFDDLLDYSRELLEVVFPYWVEHPALSFNDCFMAFDSEAHQAEPLWTFDRNLAKQHASAKLL